MFSKNKAGQHANPSEHAQSRSLSGGRSLFAPGLNPAPTHLALNQPPAVPMPQTNWGSPSQETYVPESQTSSPSQWEPTPSGTEMSFSNTATEVMAEPIMPDVVQSHAAPSVWESSLPAADPVSEMTQFDEPFMPAPESVELPPLPQELYQSEPLAQEGTATDWQVFDANTLDSMAATYPLPNEEAAPLSWESPASPPVNDTWDTLPEGGSSPSFPEEMTMNPAAFLDTVNHQLYPEDPFAVESVDPMTAVEGAHAFEEAAQFLFPETVSAMPDLQPEEPLAIEDPFALNSVSQEMNLEPMELGPSHQPEPGSLNDLSAMTLDPADVGTFMDPFEAGAESPDFGLPELPGLSTHQAIMSDPALSAAYTMGDEGPELPMSEKLAAAFDDAYTAEQTFPDETYVPPESIQTDDWGGATWSPTDSAFDDNLDAFLPPTEQEAPIVQKPAENSLDAFLSDDEDFYASAYTLSEQGDVIPAYDLQESSGELKLEPISESVAFQDEPLDWQQDLGTTSGESYVVPAAQDSAEALWHSPTVDETPASSEPVPEAFAMDRLEILGVCPLTPDKRLLLVQTNGQFALMGQSGLENPNVSVLKIFESNPIAYQQTFAAAQEGQAGEQGMFVTQVGTWHAIVSTFRDQIALHTELG